MPIKFCQICGTKIIETIHTRRKYCTKCADIISKQQRCEAKKRHRRKNVKRFLLGTEDSMDGYIKLAAIIVETEIESYHRALAAYKQHGNVKDLEQALKIEQWLLSEYYNHLTPGVDMESAVSRIRSKYGIDKRDKQN